MLGAQTAVRLASSAWWSDLDPDLLELTTDGLRVDTEVLAEFGERFAGSVALGDLFDLDVGHLPSMASVWDVISFEVVHDGGAVDLPGA